VNYAFAISQASRLIIEDYRVALALAALFSVVAGLCRLLMPDWKGRAGVVWSIPVAIWSVEASLTAVNLTQLDVSGIHARLPIMLLYSICSVAAGLLVLVLSLPALAPTLGPWAGRAARSRLAYVLGVCWLLPLSTWLFVIVREARLER
jgi:hypothetical protein